MANKIARSGDDSRDEMTFNKIVKCRKPNSDKAFYYFFSYLCTNTRNALWAGNICGYCVRLY